MSTKDLQDIIASYQTLVHSPDRGSNQSALIAGVNPIALATVIRVNGSAYRRPGARMLCLSDGGHLGTVSGGCLEADVKERCRQVHDKQIAEVVRYQVSFEDDEVSGLKLGCNGTIDVLIQPVHQLSFLNEMGDALAARRPLKMATVISAPLHREGEVGTCLTASSVESNLADALLRRNLAELLQHQCASYSIESLETTDGPVEIFVEQIHFPVRLVIFGAGNDAMPVSRLASVLGWDSIIVDRRSSLVNQQRFPGATLKPIKSYESLDTDTFIDELTACIVMTHNYMDDFHILHKLLPSDSFYIGVLGPKRRTVALLEDLQSRAQAFSEDQLRSVYAPVGLNIGAETPEEIALSIISEIQAALSKQSAGFLRDKKGPIHNLPKLSSTGPSTIIPSAETFSCPSP